MRGRAGIVAVLAAAGLGLAGLVAVLRDRSIPLGVPGEWEWNRLGPGIKLTVFEWMHGAASVAAYAAFCALGYAFLASRPRAGAVADLLAMLALGAASVAVQYSVQEAAPRGFGLAKWTFAQHSSGSHGYYMLARSDLMSDMKQFLARYPAWIREQDALHIGTHPPGLLVTWRSMLQWLRARPGDARAVLRALPESVKAGLREIDAYDLLPLGDRAALGLMGAVGLLACALTVSPLYALARWSGGSAAFAWMAASLWPLVPSGVLFQPATDVLYPVAAAASLALAARGRAGGALLAGVVLAVGMQFSLVFLVVGLLVGIALLWAPGRPVREGMKLVLMTGLGFCATTLAFWAATRANPLAIWFWNQRNHSRFYEQFERSYWPWQVCNALDVVAGVGIAVMLWAVVGMIRGRGARLGLATLAVMAVLQLSGRSLSEVARLWLPLFPPLLVTAAGGIEALGGGMKTLGATLALLGAQTLAMQATIQVVYVAAV
jgi:hypothetical protein